MVIFSDSLSKEINPYDLKSLKSEKSIYQNCLKLGRQVNWKLYNLLILKCH